MVKVFGADGLQVKSKKRIMLTDEDISASLEFIFKKTTAEVMKFNEKTTVEKIGDINDGILF